MVDSASFILSVHNSETQVDTISVEVAIQATLSANKHWCSKAFLAEDVFLFTQFKDDAVQVPFVVELLLPICVCSLVLFFVLAVYLA